jgi:quinol monooxygenase YgiN
MNPSQKEAIMLVKILIRRRFKEGSAKQIQALLKEFRAGAMNREGYVSGETLISLEDPLEMLVIGTWESMAAWERWRENEARKRFEAMLEIYQESPTRYEAFALGALSVDDTD